MMARTLMTMTLSWAICVGLTGVASATDTEFTYQGELKQNGTLANGAFDMEFTLWDALAGGNQVGGVETFDEVPVANGRFTLVLDFTAMPFSNADRWLQIEVNGVVLSPRQPIARAPYAIQTRGIFVNSDESFVGIRRDNPVSVSEVFGIYSPTTNSYGGMYVECAGQSAWPFYGYAAGPIGDMWHYYEGNTGRWHVNNGGVNRLTIESDGDVGIGTQTPQAMLHVQEGSAGAVTPHSNSSAAFERDTTNYISILSPNATERGILFGDPQSFVNGGIIYNSGPTFDGMQFRTGNNQIRMVIDNVGHVGIGEMNPDHPFEVTTTNQTAIEARGLVGVDGIADEVTGIGVRGQVWQDGGYGVYGTAPSSVTGTGVKGYASGGQGIGVHGEAFGFGGSPIGVLGEVAAPTGYDFFAAGKGINYGAPSSIRWKHNIEPVENPLNMIAQIRGVYFDWDEAHGGQRDIGCIGEEVAAVLPQIVAMDDDGVHVTGMDYSKLTPLLVEAVQALRADNHEQLATLRNDHEEQFAEMRREHAAQLDEMRRTLDALEKRVKALERLTRQ